MGSVARWLTVFEDEWPYEHSDSDLVFEKAVGPLVMQRESDSQQTQRFIQESLSR